MIHLEVAVTAPLEQTLTYSLPKTIDGEVYVDQHQNYVGRRVLVWLGKRKVTGYVLAAVTPVEKASYRIRAISKFLDEYPLFHENSVPFYRWVANYYHYPLGLVIKTALPGGLAPKSFNKIVLKIHPSDFLASFAGETPLWAQNLATHGELGAVETAGVLGDRKSKKLIDHLSKIEAVTIAQAIAKDSVQEKKEICYGFAAPASAAPERSY